MKVAPRAKKPNLTAQRRRADALFSRLVRSVGRCEAVGDSPSMSYLGDHIACRGNLQCAHVVSRRYLATRWDRINAVCLCAAHHVYFTHHPLEWTDWCELQLGSAVYAEIRRKAQAGGRPDYAAIIERLQAETD